MMNGFTFSLYGPIVPKARAQTTKNGTYHPHRYQAWKKEAITLLKPQYPWAPLSGVSINIQLIGKHNRSGDADNIAGAVLDAMVQAEILQDDNLKHVHSLVVDLQYSKKTEPYALISVAQVGEKAA